jgi:nucleotide-binding universal stress UspA family protein
MRILAATDFSTRAQRALRRAGLLARDTGAEVILVHVVDDDQPQSLIAMESREAQRIFTEQIAAMAELRGVQCRPLVVTGDPFDAILRTAADLNTDLIVMGAHRKQFLRDVFVGTTVERVIRTGPYPVLMVNNESTGGPYRTVLASIDMSAPSANAIKVAQAAGLIGNARVTLVHAFHPLAKSKMVMAGLDQASIDEYVAGQRRKAFDELAAFLIAHDLGGRGWSRHIEEGRAFEVIARAVEEARPDLLIVGTHSRSGLMKLLLGSVAEEVLRSLDVDILVVPSVADSDGADVSPV